MMVNDENEKNDKNSVSKDVNIKESAVKVELNSFSENNKEYAVIRGMDNNDEEIWSHTTGYHERTVREERQFPFPWPMVRYCGKIMNSAVLRRIRQ